MIHIRTGISYIYMTLNEWKGDLVNPSMRLVSEYTGRDFTFSLGNDTSIDRWRYNKFTVFVGDVEDLPNSYIKMGSRDEGQWEYSVLSNNIVIEKGRLLFTNGELTKNIVDEKNNILVDESGNNIIW